MKRIRVTISGRVQGVNFRWSTNQKALEEGVTGWVKNTDDGKVEAEFQGEDNKVENMLNFVKNGPCAAHVTGLQTEELPVNETLNSFEILSTY
jgi:acylphosphatase